MEAFARLDLHLRDLRRRAALEGLGNLAAATLGVVTTLGLTGAVWASRVSSFAVQRRLLLLGLAVWLAAALAWWVWRRVRLARDPIRLARLVQRRVPALGRGIETVIRLRSQAFDEDAAFSAGLLVAEADRAADVLESLPQKKWRRRRTAWRLGLASLLPVLLGLAWLAVDPWPAIRGVRGLVGIADAATPSWLIGPAHATDVLAFDIRAAMLRRNPDGSVTRVPGDESGDVSAPVGTEVEVSGRLSRPVGLGYLVVTGKETERVPLMLGPGDVFRAVFPVRSAGTWHLEVVAPPGILLAETARRRVVPVEPGRPAVDVVPPDRLALRPGESTVVRFVAKSSSGLSGVDAVYEFPVDPARTPVRVRVQDAGPGVRRLEGEIPFTLPDDVLDAGGRVDLVVEAMGVLGRGPEDVGRAPPVRFLLDSPEVRSLAMLEDRERLLVEVLDLLASVSQAEDAAEDVVPVVARERLETLLSVARAVTNEAAGERGNAATLLKTVVTDLEALVSEPNADRADILPALERAVLTVDDVVNGSRGAILASRLAGLTRDGVRLRQGGGGEAAAREALRTVVRSRRTLGLLDGMRRHWSREAELDGSMLRFVPARLARLSMRAREGLLAVEEWFRDGGTDARERREVQETAASALAEVVQAFSDAPMPGAIAAAREIVLPKEVLTGLRQALTIQRDVMDRTAQAAFLLKRRTDQLAGQRAPDAGRLADLVGEALVACARVDVGNLDPAEAQELASARDDLGATADLLGQGDLVTARRLVTGTLERLAVLSQDWRDVADWSAEEQPEASAYLRAQATRLARALTPLRDAARVLADWDRERSGVVTRDDRENASRMLHDQERALALMGRAADTLRRAAGSDADEHVTIAMSARRNMEEAATRLDEVKPAAAEAHQRQAVQDMQRLRKSLERGAVELRGHAAGLPLEDDRVTLPPAARRPPGDDFAREVRAHAGDPVPPTFADVVRAYYEAILQP